MSNKDRIQRLEGFEELREEFMKSEMFREMLEEMIPNLSVGELIKALSPEQRNALTNYDALLSLSDEELRRLPDAFVDSLPEDIRNRIRRRTSY